MRNVNHFFLLLSPKEVMTFVALLKERVANILGHSYESRYSLAHITLLICCDYHNESKLYTAKIIADHTKPFSAYARGFGVFYHGPKRTIYLKLAFSYPISQLCERLGIIITPHITIVKNISLADFNRIEGALAESLESFSRLLYFDKITVLKWQDGRWVNHTPLRFAQAS